MKLKLISLTLFATLLPACTNEPSDEELQLLMSKDSLLVMASRPDEKTAQSVLRASPEALELDPWLSIYAYKAIAAPSAAQTAALSSSVGNYFEAQHVMLAKALASADAQAIDLALQRAVNANQFESSGSVLERRTMQVLHSSKESYVPEQIALVMASAFANAYPANAELGVVKACATAQLPATPARPSLCWANGELMLKHATQISEAIIAIGVLRQAAQTAEQKHTVSQRSSVFDSLLNDRDVDQEPSIAELRANLEHGEVQAYLRTYAKENNLALPAEQLRAIDAVGERMLRKTAGG